MTLQQEERSRRIDDAKAKRYQHDADVEAEESRQDHYWREDLRRLEEDLRRLEREGKETQR